MDNIDIIYTTPEQQIEKLKSQNLTIPNEELAKDYLQVYGYSNLIKSYRDPYVLTIDGKKVYRSGVTLDRIASLYSMDKAFRNAVMASMQDLEEHVKECAADVIAKSFGTNQNNYLNPRNYRDKRRRKERFSLSEILKTMRNTLNTDKYPIKHYSDKYGIIPPWILFKSIYFTTIVNYISLFKTKEQEALAQKLYDTNSKQLPMESFRKLMMDTLFICIDYRNISAHGGRVYNYISDKKLRSKEIFNCEDFGGCGFGQLLLLLSFFKYQEPFLRLRKTLEREITRHCNMFPQDETYLAQILQIDLERKRMVYLSKGSKKFHNSPHCSGIKSPISVAFDSLDQSIYTPCKRCSK